MPQPQKNVFLVWRPWLGPFAISLARRMKADGFAVHLYVSRPIDVKTVEKKAGGDVFTRIAPFQFLYERACQPVTDDEAELQRALAHESWLGVPYARLAVADRHFGRGYSLGGPNFPTSAQSRARPSQIQAAFSGQVEFWRGEIEQHKPEFVIDGDLLLYLVARRYNVPYRLTAASRHQNYYYWAETPFMETSRLEPAFHAASDGLGGAPAYDVQPATTIDTYWKTAMAAATWPHMMLAVAKQFYRRARMLSLGIPMVPGYDILSNVRYLYRRRRQLAELTRPTMPRLTDIRGRRLVFFPLATEPEMTLQGLSPEYFFQLEAIAAVARSLPSDTLLLVKEHHPACGARADIFYDQIRAFKNVVMLDLRERGVDVIRRADVTVTIAGSAGFEAAAMGKAVIALGRNNIFNFMPNVRVVTDIADMDQAIADALVGKVALTDAHINGARFLKAVEDISFDMEAFDPFSPASAMADETADAAYRNLLSSFTAPATRIGVAHV